MFITNRVVQTKWFIQLFLCAQTIIGHVIYISSDKTVGKNSTLSILQRFINKL